MRGLLIEHGNKFFKLKLAVSLTTPDHMEELDDKIEDINISRSRFVD